MILFITLFTYATPPLHFSFSPLFCCHAYAIFDIIIDADAIFIFMPFSADQMPFFFTLIFFDACLTLLPLIMPPFRVRHYVIAACVAAAADFRFHADAAAAFSHAAAMLPAPCPIFSAEALMPLIFAAFSRRRR
jgi:hypothetical protein